MDIKLTRRFSCIPYHYGEMEIVSIHHQREYKGFQSEEPINFYHVRGRIIKGSTTSRLFTASRSDPMREGSMIDLYGITARELVLSDHLQYTYPVG